MNSNIRITEGSNHALHSIQPDTWNNIPICLVKAIKMIIDNVVNLDNRLKQTNVNMD